MWSDRVKSMESSVEVIWRRVDSQLMFHAVQRELAVVNTVYNPANN